MDINGVNLERSVAGPVYLQLYFRFREAIASGKLAPGDRVPSVRSLASELNLARGTVEAAYDMLVGEGYLATRGPAGTFVSPRLEGSERPEPAIVRPVRQAALQAAAAEPMPFQMGLPALDAFPRKTWARLAGRQSRGMHDLDLAYPEAGGYAPLRQAIAAYLGIARGIACTPEQILVTAGYSGALDLIAHTLLRPGDIGWYEDPGYPIARRLLERIGMRLAPVPVDDEGLDVSAGQRRAGDARFAVVTPTHQSPLGVALTLPRRLALLEWARNRHAWIIEDDYDSEFRYHGRPLPALKSLDRHGRVLYAGTFSKTLYPGLRLGYLVVPETQIDAFRSMEQALGSSCPRQLQRITAEFIEQGHFARHLKRMRGLYAERRDFLNQALQAEFADALQIPVRAGGLHALAYWTPRRDDKAFVRAARDAGFAAQALSGWSVLPRPPSGLLLGFANLTSAAAARRHVQRLRRACAA